VKNASKLSIYFSHNVTALDDVRNALPCDSILVVPGCVRDEVAALLRREVLVVHEYSRCLDPILNFVDRVTTASAFRRDILLLTRPSFALIHS
jgi:hypothetical protein